ncbi:MAG: hypothetical protein R3C11_11530 [Planctomycetaceae bacterium]
MKAYESLDNQGACHHAARQRSLCHRSPGNSPPAQRRRLLEDADDALLAEAKRVGLPTRRKLSKSSREIATEMLENQP